MKVPSKHHLGKILQKHTNRSVKVKRDAASLMHLRYLLFIKALAKEADNMAYSQNRNVLKVTDVIEAEKIVGNISETARISSRKQASRTSSSSSQSTQSSGLQSSSLDSRDSRDEESESLDSESEESE